MKPRINRLLQSLRVSPGLTRTVTLGFGIAITGLSIQSTRADTGWTGNNSSDWTDSGNWDNGLPGSGNGAVFIDQIANNTPLLSTDVTAGWDILIGNGGNTGALNQNAGTLATGNGNWGFIGVDGGSNGSYNLGGSGSFSAARLQMGWGGGTATMTVNTSGSVDIYGGNSGDWWRANAWDIGRDAANAATVHLQNGTINVLTGETWLGSFSGGGTLNQSGGTFNAAGLAIAKFWNGSSGVTQGTANITGGTLNSSWITIGAAGSASDAVNGSMTVSGTGTVNSEGDLVVAYAGNSSSSGTLTINSGGTVNVGSTTERWLVLGQWDSTKSALTVNSGGTLNLHAGTDIESTPGNNTGNRVINVDGGSIIGSGAANNNGSLIHLTGGGTDTLTIRNSGLVQVKAVYGDNAATMNFDNGTLRAVENDSGFVNLWNGSVKVLAGGATVDSNGFDVEIHNGLLDGGGGGGLTKNGAGTLTLSGNSTYTGATVVNAGTLYLTGSLGDTAIAIADGATVAGNASLAGDLDFASGATILFSTTDTLAVTGTVTFGGIFGIANLIGLDNTVDVGTYTLISGTVDFTNVTDIGLANAVDLGGGKSAYLQQGSLEVVVIPEPASALLGGLGTLCLLRRRRR